MRKQYHTRTVGPDRYTWDVHRLVRLAQAETPVAIALSDIAELDELWWFQNENDRPTPRAVAQHMALVRDTDLAFPILLCADGRLMDGMHRVLKALLEGRKTIKAVSLRPTPAPDYVNVDVTTLDYTDEAI